jgi:hypothetical protein
VLLDFCWSCFDPHPSLLHIQTNAFVFDPDYSSPTWWFQPSPRLDPAIAPGTPRSAPPPLARHQPSLDSPAPSALPPEIVETRLERHQDSRRGSGQLLLQYDPTPISRSYTQNPLPRLIMSSSLAPSSLILHLDLPARIQYGHRASVA